MYNPNDLGSGGGAIQGFGGNGGGLARIIATDMILNGSILSGGGAGSNRASCGGSGGGIHITTGTLSGAGIISANGGNAPAGHSGGGGGRIAIYYTDISGFNTTNILAHGGTGLTVPGGAGTIFLQSSSQTHGNLIVDNNNLSTTGYTTILPSVGTGVSTSLTTNGLGDTGANWTTNDLSGIFLNPNTAQGSLFKILSNTTNTITTDSLDGDLLLVSALGDTYKGKYIFDNLIIRGLASLKTDDEIKVLSPTDPANNQFVVNGQIKAASLDISASNFVASNGGISAGIVTQGSLTSLSLTNSTLDTTSRLSTTALGLNNSNLTVYNNLDAATVTVDNNSVLSVGGLVQSTDISVLNGSSITHPVSNSTAEYRLEINTGTMMVDSTSSVDVTGQGYLGGKSGDNTIAKGRTLGNTTTGGSGSYAGGGYGGLGGQFTSGYYRNTTYGSLYNPNELGSGGAGTIGSGGNGGGLVRITATGMVMNGNIVANGGNGSNRTSCGGSGGGIYIQAGTLSGTGLISAKGGTAPYGHSGGGGGRIAVYYTDITGFNTANISAHGGAGVTAGGGAGTIFLQSSSQTHGDLIVDNNNISTTGYTTPLASVGNGVATSLVTNNLGNTGENWTTNDLTGIYLNPNSTQGSVFKILSNTANSITTDSLDGDMLLVSTLGDTYEGKYIFDNLFIRGLAKVSTLDHVKVLSPTDVVNNKFTLTSALKAKSLEIPLVDFEAINGELIADLIAPGTMNTVSLTNSTLEVGNTIPATNLGLTGSSLTSFNGLDAANITVDNASQLSINGIIQATDIFVTNNSVITHPNATSTTEYRLVINTGTLNLDATSSVDVTAKGYLGGRSGDNKLAKGRTIGNTTTGGSVGHAGGGYGGLGGQFNNAYYRNTTYGSLYNPDDLGSGGGAYRGVGGNGGGLVKITATGMVINGNILANGGNGSNRASDGGSGGGINIQTGTLSGTGLISANGGSTTSGQSGGGAGRIAIYYSDITGFNTVNIMASGGTGISSNGGAGTIYLKSNAQSYGDLIVDNNNVTTVGYTTTIPSIGPGSSTGMTVDTLTDTSRNWRPGDLFYLYLNPDVNQVNNPATVFLVTANTPDTITVDNSTGYLTDIGSLGSSYIGEHYLDNITIVNGAAAETLDNVYYFGSLITTAGMIQANNFTQQGKLNEADPSIKLAKGPNAPMAKKNPEAKPTTLAQNPVKPGKDKPVEKVTKTLPTKPARVSINTKALTQLAFASSKVSNTSATMRDIGPEVRLPESTEKKNPHTPRYPWQNKEENLKSEIKNPQCAAGSVDPQYTYDINGNKTSMITPYGTWTYSYDLLNRLTSITNPNGEITSFTYDALGRRTSMTQANGVVTTYTYDSNSRLTGMVSAKGGVSISSYSYTYDKLGNRVSMMDNSGTHNYTYDNQYRLIGATHPSASNPTENFTYDPVGNRLSSHLSANYIFDNLNRLLEDDQFTYTYDDNGNLISKVDKVTTATTTYQYDGENKLIGVTTPTDVVQYQYDGFGRRTAKTVNGVVTNYVYDGEDILFEVDANGVIIAKYTHGPGTDEPISVERDTDRDGVLDATYFYQYDGLGSVIALTDANGGVAQMYNYDSFGNIMSQAGAIPNRYTYTGREWDQESGLYFYRARYYDTNVGRFISKDPKGFNSGSINFFVYVKNNPIKYIDPWGLESIEIPGDPYGDKCSPFANDALIDLGNGSYQQIKRCRNKKNIKKDKMSCEVKCYIATFTCGLSDGPGVVADTACSAIGYAICVETFCKDDKKKCPTNP